MTQQELIWMKLALLAELRQVYPLSDQSSILVEKWGIVYDSLWSDLKNAKVEEPVQNATECPCGAPEQAAECVPEVDGPITRPPEWLTTSTPPPIRESNR